MERVLKGVLLAVFLFHPACSDLAERLPPPDAGADSARDTGIFEPPDPPGPSPWTRRTPAISPTPRAGHGLAYDPVRRKVILFGGYSTKTLRDLWEWDGETGTWLDRTPTAIPTAWPAPRTSLQLVWDPARQRVVLFAGDTTRGSWLKDLWEWDGQTGLWVNRTPVMPAPGTWPPARFGCGLVADELRGKLVMFGGGYQNIDAGVDGADFGDTWEWDGVAGTWTERTPMPRPLDWPRGRHGHAMIWDARGQRPLMFMGLGDRTAGYDLTVWQWDGVMGLWSRLNPDPPPAPWPIGRQDHGLVWDAARERVLLFAGWQPPPPGDDIPSDPFRDVWELDPLQGTWIDRTLPIGSVAWPLGRGGQGMVYDAGRQRVVLFGGGLLGARLQDTWEWNGSAP